MKIFNKSITYKYSTRGLQNWHTVQIFAKYLAGTIICGIFAYKVIAEYFFKKQQFSEYLA